MVRKIKPVIYIFCEWKTEEKYFQKLKRILRNTSSQIKTFDLEWWTKIKDHPKRVQRFIKSKLKHEKIAWLTQKVFIVFDLDIFNPSQLQNTQNILKDFDLIVSNETFEYWILSHFEEYDLPKWKIKYLNKIKKYLPNLGNDKFTWANDFNWLNMNNIKTAIKNAKEVNNTSSWNLKNRDPYSNVYEIIEFLEN